MSISENEKETLAALNWFLDMTDQSDWHLLHADVRRDVISGKYSGELEVAYKELVDCKLMRERNNG